MSVLSTATTEAYHQSGEPTRFIKNDLDQWWQPDPPRVTYSDLMAGLTALGELMGQAFDVAKEAVVEALRPVFLDATKRLEALEPLIEVTEGHHAVCDHKPRCKKPPQWSSINKQATQRRRGR